MKGGFELGINILSISISPTFRFCKAVRNVLGQLTGEQKPDGSLDLPGGDGGPLVVVSQTRGLSSYTLEDVVDEAVHDAHGLARHTSVGVDLLQHLVDVDGVAFLPPLLVLLLVTLRNVLDGLAGLLDCLAACFRCHGDSIQYTSVS
ncbi:hypothetical protein TSAR_005880 [Trichomalopsis sarcophagae]|uniref:Uncharacterized protein n=1 Tax=Trichomalopsis sarcophagae TaxID=543379 RepID=A0A232EPX0_9HYME|nr:hypothetical protein TSAR_005880 [Trichomalopsis sarcophagae]